MIHEDCIAQAEAAGFNALHLLFLFQQTGYLTLFS